MFSKIKSITLCAGIVFLSSIEMAHAEELIWREVFANKITNNLAVTSKKNKLVVTGVGDDGRVYQNVNTSSNPENPNWKNWKSLQQIKDAKQIVVSDTLEGGAQLTGVSDKFLFSSELDKNGRFQTPTRVKASEAITELDSSSLLSKRRHILGLSPQGEILAAAMKKGKYRNWNALAELLSVPGGVSSAFNKKNETLLIAGIGKEGVRVYELSVGNELSELTVLRGKDIVSVTAALSSSGNGEIYGIDSSGIVWESRQVSDNAWSDWESPVRAVAKSIYVENQEDRTVLFVVTQDNLLISVTRSGGEWKNQKRIPVMENLSEFAVTASKNGAFNLVALDDESRLWVTKIMESSSYSVAALAQGPRYPNCTEYLPYDQYTDNWTNRFHMMVATPGAKTQTYYYTASVTEESLAYSLFYDVTGGLSLAGCRPTKSIMGALENMGEATNNYDTNGRISSQTGSYNGSSYTMLYGYNNYGFIESVRRNGDLCIEAGYDVMQRVNKVSVHRTGSCSDIFSNKQSILFGYLSTLSTVPNFAYVEQYKNDIVVITGTADINYSGSNFNVNIPTKITEAGSSDKYRVFSFETTTEIANNLLAVDQVTGRLDGTPVKLNQYFYESERYGFQDEINNGVNLEITTLDQQVNYVLFGVGPIGLNYALTYE